MSALEAARDRFLAQADAGVRADEPGWLAALRRDARASFAALGLPTTRWEEWRYTSLNALAAVPFEPAPETGIERAALEETATPLFACSLYVYANGRFAPALSAPATLPGGARCESLSALLEDPAAPVESILGRHVDLKTHPFAALNTACFEDGALVRVPRGDDVREPIHLVFANAGDGQDVVHPRVVVRAEAGSRVTVIQDHVALSDGPSLTNAVTEVHVGPGAEVRLVLLQREPGSRFHISNLQVRQERDSRFSAHTLALGGALVRNDLGVALVGEGAECRLDGLFVGGGSQLIDNHTHVDHAVPHCTSAELYKGVLGGSARGVFRGRVLVRPDAQKTNARQSNPNLLIGRKAEIDSKPQLEIHADDVKCSHGSTIGQLDEEALFYLRSRGIGVERARDLLTRAFALEVLQGLPVPALAEGLDELVHGRLRSANLEGAA